MIVLTKTVQARKKINKYKKIQYIQHYVNNWGDEYSGVRASVSKTDSNNFNIGSIYEVSWESDLKDCIWINNIVVDVNQFRYIIEYNPINALLYPELHKTFIKGEYWLVEDLPELFPMTESDYTYHIKECQRKLKKLNNLDK